MITPGTYVIIRSSDAGIHAGTLESYDPATRTANLLNSRRLWYWAGAFTLSELATNGPKRPGECKFATTVAEIVVLDICEIINATSAETAIKAVPDYQTR